MKELKEKHLCYVSFATDDGWIGGGFVELDFEEHLDPRARMDELGLNPGGEILCIPVRTDMPAIDKKFWNRLIVTPEELAKAFNDKVWKLSEGFIEYPASEAGLEARIDDGSFGRVCEEHNKPTKVN